MSLSSENLASKFAASNSQLVPLRREDGTRDALEAFFQRLDADGDRVLTLEEFEAHFDGGDAAAMGKQSEEAEAAAAAATGNSQTSLAASSRATAALPVAEPIPSYAKPTNGIHISLRQYYSLHCK